MADNPRTLEEFYGRKFDQLNPLGEFYTLAYEVKDNLDPAVWQILENQTILLNALLEWAKGIDDLAFGEDGSIVSLLNEHNGRQQTIFENDRLYQTTADELLAIAPCSTMAHWRSEGRGPAFIKIGPKVVYRGDDLNAWLRRNTIRHEPDAAQPK